MACKITTGKLEHQEECCRILINSELNRVYFSDKKPQKMIARGFENEEILVALNKENQCIGFIWSEVNGTFGKYPYIHMVIVDNRFQGKGIGQALLNYFEKTVAIKYDKVFLMVGDFNIRAKSLYEKLSYKVVGVLPDFYTNGVDEYLMMKIKGCE